MLLIYIILSLFLLILIIIIISNILSFICEHCNEIMDGFISIYNILISQMHIIDSTLLVDY